MRTIERTGRFKRDYKRETKGPHRSTLESEQVEIVKALAQNRTLPKKDRDHVMAGDQTDHRDCHIKPGLILIYRNPDVTRLQLLRLGSHAELGI
jgi:mRNA interferase YafQ